MWFFGRGASPLTDLVFVNEVEFRAAAREYRELSERFRRVFTQDLTYYAADVDFLIDLLGDHRVVRDRLVASIRNAEAIFRNWSEVRVEHPSGMNGPRIFSTRANAAVTDNLHLLGQIIDAADDPSLVVRRKRRELEKNGHDSRRVFIVHGHDQEALQLVREFLISVGMVPVILHERANQGETVIEKFEKHSDVGFAVVLLTPDDSVMSSGQDNGAQTILRARQNVVLELGYFIAKLGRDRVCSLRKGDVEVPSDILGVVYTDFDAGGGWRIELLRELLAGGYDVSVSQLQKRA